MEVLQRIKAGQPLPTPPTKIAYRTTDEETLRKRRGF
jgi:hypothetical protein